MGPRTIREIVMSGLQSGRPTVKKTAFTVRVPEPAVRDLKNLAHSLGETPASLASQLLLRAVYEARGEFEDITDQLPLEAPKDVDA